MKGGAQRADALRLVSTLYDRTLLKNWGWEDEDQSGDQGLCGGTPYEGAVGNLREVAGLPQDCTRCLKNPVQIIVTEAVTQN